MVIKKQFLAFKLAKKELRGGPTATVNCLSSNHILSPPICQKEQRIISLHYLSPALHMSLSAKVSYKDYSKTTKNLFIDHYPICMSDLLRPLDINTEEFENRWKEAHFEKRQKIESSGIKDAKDLAEKSRTLLNLHPVEIIGMVYSLLQM